MAKIVETDNFGGDCPDERFVKEVKKMPEPGELRFCLVCAVEKPWGIYDPKTGAAVCIECRDKARA